MKVCRLYPRIHTSPGTRWRKPERKIWDYHSSLALSFFFVNLKFLQQSKESFQSLSKNL